MQPETDNLGRIQVAEVVFDPRTSGKASLYTYLNPHGAEPGDVVLAPLGPRTLLGVVVSAGRLDGAELLFDVSKLKPIPRPIDGLRLPPHGVALARFVAEEYLCSLGSVTSLMLIPGVKERLVQTWVLLRDPEPGELLTPSQEEAVRVLRELGGAWMASKSRTLEASALRALRSLRERNIVAESHAFQPIAETLSLPGSLQLTSDMAKAERYLLASGRKKPAQAVVLMRLMEAPNASFSPQELKALCGVSESTLKALHKASLLVEESDGTRGPQKPPTPTEQQRMAIDHLVKAIDERDSNGFLLYGVTGSGKTEVFLRSAGHVLGQGRQVLYLVPEIALTAQVIGQLRARFGANVAVLHSNLAPGERQRTWMQIARGETPVILGPRSALFAPIRNLGLIIMDEEHESSYKQENVPRYHTKRLVQFLAEQHRCPYVLGSATPSVESYYESIHGNLTRLELTRRATGAVLPEVMVESLSAMYQAGAPSLLTAKLFAEIRLRLERKEQTVLFLNRRAYAPLLGCRDCGHVITCPDCSVSLSYHKHKLELVCHYCDHRRPAPDVCPSCGSDKLRPLGMGTEKVEETIKSLFPEARVARLDRDVTRRKGALEEILANMRTGEIDILIGTQMVAKGLDFPNVTLVGVVLADTSLHLPDFRAFERTFQLLTQVSGRAGRGSRPGEVVVQTFDPHHLVISTAQEHDYLSFYYQAIAEREQVGYPPFNRLVNIVLSGASEVAVDRAAVRLRDSLVQLTGGLGILGPSRCAIERLAGQWRRHILVKLGNDEPVSPIAEAVDALDTEGVQVTIDVDPQSML